MTRRERRLEKGEDTGRLATKKRNDRRALKQPCTKDYRSKDQSDYRIRGQHQALWLSEQPATTAANVVTLLLMSRHYLEKKHVNLLRVLADRPSAIPWANRRRFNWPFLRVLYTASNRSAGLIQWKRKEA